MNLITLLDLALLAVPLFALLGAVTVTTIRGGTYSGAWDVEETADADLGSGSITHGLPEAPENATICWLLLEASLSFPFLSTRSSTVLATTSESTAGSGAAGAQYRINASVVHSIDR